MEAFDLHPKPATTARKKTVLGGVLTTLTIIIAIILLYYRAKLDFGKTSEDVRINTLAHDEKVPVSFIISFLDISSCNGLYKVETLDALGREEKDDDANVVANYYLDKKLCKLTGEIHVPVGKGTFRIYPTSPNNENIHGNHQIEKLAVGPALWNVPEEARYLKTEEAMNKRVGAWTYFLSLVPTSSNGKHGYQIAATRNFIELLSPLAARGSLYFYYESSPVRMHVDSRITVLKALHFSARGIGIISGLFVLVGISREVLLNLCYRKSKKKAKLAM